MAVGPSLSVRAAGRRGGGCLAWDRRCRHRRTPQKREDRKGIGVPAPRPCAGEVARINHESRLQTGTTRRGERVPGSGSPVMGPRTLPGSESSTGTARKSLSHQSKPEPGHTQPALRIAQPRFLSDGVLAQREYARPLDRRMQVGLRNPLRSKPPEHVSEADQRSLAARSPLGTLRE